MDELPPIDSFVTVPFGYKSRQIAHVVAHTKTGRVKIRAWNASRNEWMPGLRTLPRQDLKPSQAAGLPAPPHI